MENKSLDQMRSDILKAGRDESVSGYDLKDDVTGELNSNYEAWFGAWENEQQKVKENPDYVPLVKMRKNDINTEFTYDSNGDGSYEATIIFDKNKNRLFINVINEDASLPYIGTSEFAGESVSVVDKQGHLRAE